MSDFLKSVPLKAWIGPFLDRYRQRLACDDWPAQGTEANRQFVLGWYYVLNSKHVTEAEADAASKALMLVPPKMRQDHIPALIGMVEKMREQRREKPATLAPVAEAVRAQPPVPLPPGFPFPNWLAWSKAGAPLSAFNEPPEAGAQKKPAGSNEATHTPQPVGASTN